MFVIVMEYAAGGELFDQVVADHDAKILSEEAVKLQFFQKLEMLMILLKMWRNSSPVSEVVRKQILINLKLK